MDALRVSAGNWVIGMIHETSPVTGIISTTLENGDAQQKDAGCYCRSPKRREEQHNYQHCALLSRSCYKTPSNTSLKARADVVADVQEAVMD